MKCLFKLSFIILLSNFLISDSSINKIDNNIKKNNAELNKIIAEIQRLEKEISDKSKEEKNNREIINKLNSKIELTEKLIKSLNKEENYLSNLIYKTEQNIKIKEEELNILKNQLKNRLKYLYKYGKSEVLSEVASSESWSDIIYRNKYLEVLNQSEEKIKKRINDSIENLKLEKKALKKEKARKTYLLNEKDKEFIKLEKDKKKKEKYISNIKNQKKKLTSNLQVKKVAMKQIEKIISKLYNDKEELKKREEELIKLRSKQNKSTSDNFIKMKGKLPWPVSGDLIGKFGIKTNPELNTQYENIGIDIKTKSSEDVLSVLDGVVLSITLISGYGKVIILDHGHGYYTVYSNIDNINVSENEYIPSLHKLGKVAKNNSSQYNKDYIFHFQVWGNKEKLNPQDWLKKK